MWKQKLLNHFKFLSLLQVGMATNDVDARSPQEIHHCSWQDGKHLVPPLKRSDVSQEALHCKGWQDTQLNTQWCNSITCINIIGSTCTARQNAFIPCQNYTSHLQQSSSEAEHTATFNFDSSQVRNTLVQSLEQYPHSHAHTKTSLHHIQVRDAFEEHFTSSSFNGQQIQKYSSISSMMATRGMPTSARKVVPRNWKTTKKTAHH